MLSGEEKYSHAAWLKEQQRIKEQDNAVVTHLSDRLDKLTNERDLVYGVLRDVATDKISEGIGMDRIYNALGYRR